MKTLKIIRLSLFFALSWATTVVYCQEPEKGKSMDIYGFIMMDAGYNFDKIQADWFDVVYYPVKNDIAGVELRYGDRTSFRDGFDTNIFKVQVPYLL